jgi:hypothetical protein
LSEVAAHSDVLILGETHGTKEVPAVAATLLEQLTKLRYGALALEIPVDEQGPLTDWATGKTEKVPGFFAKPLADGRGNIQALSLIRVALSPPFRWQLICFDQTLADASAEARKLFKNGQRKPSEDDVFALSVRRDVQMAATFSSERARFVPNAKVLAICGNLHARTSNHAPAHNPLSKLWPSFAAALAKSNPTWRVRSVNVVPQSAAYFALSRVQGGEAPAGGKVEAIRSTRKVVEAEAHAVNDADWNWELNLPRVTPATFLRAPSADPSPPTALRRGDR